MEYIKIILAAVFFLLFFVGITILKIKLRGNKSKEKSCTNPDIEDKTRTCSGCQLTEICNHKD